MSKKKHISCPKKHISCLKKHISCPKKHISCPKKHISCPKKHISCPKKHISCPKKHISCPKKHISCPKKHISCPKKHISCPKKHISCPKKHISCQNALIFLDFGNHWYFMLKLFVRSKFLNQLNNSILNIEPFFCVIADKCPFGVAREVLNAFNQLTASQRNLYTLSSSSPQVRRASAQPHNYQGLPSVPQTTNSLRNSHPLQSHFGRSNSNHPHIYNPHVYNPLMQHNRV